MKINIKQLLVYKQCTNEFIPKSRKCSYCIARDLCLLTEKHYNELKLPNQKRLCDNYV